MTDLYFNENGKFRILMISDIQERGAYNEKTLQSMNALMDSLKPDLVILGGDNVDGRYVKGKEKLRTYLDIFTKPMEDRNIPWMHIYGNHDYDCEVDGDEQNRMYAAYPHNIPASSPAGVPGFCNYLQTIKDKKTGKDRFAIYALDTHHRDQGYREGLTIDDILLENHSKMRRKWDFVRFEQLMWYWNTSKELESKNGGKVPAMAVMHVSPPELEYCLENPEQTHLEGCTEETIQSSCLNSGLFATMLQRGDINIIAAGHIHKDTVSAVFGGITLCHDGSIGFSVGGKDSSRGGRVFDINEDGTFNTYFVAAQDIVELKHVGKSVCGKHCSECEHFLAEECKGCRKSAVTGKCVIPAGRCEIYDCCADKFIPHCSVCKNYPCNKLSGIV